MKYVIRFHFRMKYGIRQFGSEMSVSFNPHDQSDRVPVRQADFSVWDQAVRGRLFLPTDILRVLRIWANVVLCGNIIAGRATIAKARKRVSLKYLSGDKKQRTEGGRSPSSTRKDQTGCAWWWGGCGGRQQWMGTDWGVRRHGSAMISRTKYK